MYLLSVITGCSTASSNSLLNHDCVGRIGGITRAFIDSNDVLFRTGYTMPNGANKYTNWFSQLIDIASIYEASGSGIQEAYLCNYLSSLDAKRSISGMLKHSINDGSVFR